MEESLAYLGYAQKLAEFDYVISARLHTNVIALAVRVPVITIEGKVWKTKELFEQLEYPLPTADSSEPGWEATVNAAIDEIENGQVDFLTYFGDRLEKHEARTRENVSWCTNRPL